MPTVKTIEGEEIHRSVSPLPPFPISLCVRNPLPFSYLSRVPLFTHSPRLLRVFSLFFAECHSLTHTLFSSFQPTPSCSSLLKFRHERRRRKRVRNLCISPFPSPLCLAYKAGRKEGEREGEEGGPLRKSTSCSQLRKGRGGGGGQERAPPLLSPLLFLPNSSLPPSSSVAPESMCVWGWGRLKPTSLFLSNLEWSKDSTHTQPASGCVGEEKRIPLPTLGCCRQGRLGIKEKKRVSPLPSFVRQKKGILGTCREGKGEGVEVKDSDASSVGHFSLLQ